jgi:hypothetical protein
MDDEIATSILDKGQQAPILVRAREAGIMKRETLAIADIYVPVKRRVYALLIKGGTRTALGSCWLKACIGWKPPKRSVKKLSSVSLLTCRGTNDCGG